MNSRSLLFFILLSSSFFFSYGQRCSHRGASGSLRNSPENLRSDSIDVLNYDISLNITDLTGGFISGNTRIQFSSLISNLQQLPLDLLALNIDSVTDGNTILNFSYNDTLVLIDLPAPLSINDTSEVVVYYNGIPVMDPSGWGGFYFQSGYAFNLGVGFQSIPHNYGRVWHPCFDNFVERATYDFRITTSNGNVAYCNGHLISEQNVGGVITRHWRMEQPITTYLASVAVSSYTHVEQEYISSLYGDTSVIYLIAQPGDTSAMKSSFVNLNDAIASFEEGFGDHYFDKVGFVLVPFSSGAMEHATNIAYPRIVANGTTAYETLMAHELSHHWWGDNVTCLTAEDMWLNEGFASWSEKWFLEYLYGPQAYFNEVRANHKNVLWKAHIDDGGWHALSSMPLDFTYGTTTYDKGADVIHTLRGYLGDSLFFAGLKKVFTDHPQENLSSNDLRDILNTVNGINCNDFFADWIFQPGFPEFSIDSFTVVPSGSAYNVTLYVHQRIKGANHLANNVPLQVSFRDQNWNKFDASISCSGLQTITTVSVPFAPAMVTLNEDEKISDAVTGDNLVVTTTGLKNIGHANFILIVNSISDSALVRAEQHWVGPDGNVLPPFLFSLSPDRYWRVNGLDLENAQITGRFSYNGSQNGSGFLDNQLMIDHGTVVFHEDSLVLMYRSNVGAPWQEYPSYTLNTQASKTDKVGLVLIDSLKKGDYVLALKTSALGIPDEIFAEKLSIFPNPSVDKITIDLPDGNGSEKGVIDIYDFQGRWLEQFQVSGSQFHFDVSDLKSGSYFVRYSRDGKAIGHGQFIHAGHTR